MLQYMKRLVWNWKLQTRVWNILKNNGITEVYKNVICLQIKCCYVFVQAFWWSISLLQGPKLYETEYFFGKKKSNSNGFHGIFPCLLDLIILMDDTDVKFHSVLI